MWMRRVFYFFIIFSFLVSFCFGQIYVSESNFDEQVEILVEGAQNESVYLISPSGLRDEIKLINGQGEFFANEQGKWIVEFGGERKDIFVQAGAVEIAGTKIERMSYFDFVKWGAIFAIMLVIFVAMLIVCLAYFRGKNIVPRLYLEKVGVKKRIIFEAGINSLDNVRIFVGDEIVMRSKKLGARRKIEIELESKKLVSAKYERCGQEFRVDLEEGGSREEEVKIRRKLERI